MYRKESLAGSVTVVKEFLIEVLIEGVVAAKFFRADAG